MTIYHATLDPARYPVVIAHLLPDDVLTVAWPDGVREIPGDPAGEFTWIAFHVDDPCPRICRYLAALRLAQNTPLRMRRPVTLAVRAIRAGGAAVIEYGDAQTYWDRTERGPVRFEVVEACELAAATSHSAGRALFNTLNPNLESL